MIDFSNEIFTALATPLRAKFEGVTIVGESVSQPAAFPCVTVDETNNITAHRDSAERERYSDVTYRVQVFSNAATGKRAEARAIFKEVCDIMYGLNLMRKTYSTTPDIYNAAVYKISATFEGTIREDGTIFRR